MAAPDVLVVEHANLPGGMVSFTDDEIVQMDVRREQVVVQQKSQSGNVTFVYVGQERYEFDIQFFIFYQDSLEKLELVRALHQEFTLKPFIYEEPLTQFQVFWPEQPTLREQWVRGRRQAHWDHPVTWIETEVVPCLPVTIPS
jgi:hypothetical protein